MENVPTDFPKSLDTIVTKNGEMARLRLAEYAEIDQIRQVIVAPEPWPNLCAIRNWRLISHSVNTKHTRRINIIGDIGNNRCVMTDWLRGLDLSTGIALTGSGALHRLSGHCGAGEPTEWQLRYVNSYLQRQDTEGYFGIAPCHMH